MGLAYDEYLKSHRSCVLYGFTWMIDDIGAKKLNDIFPKADFQKIMKNVLAHDKSKYSPEEYYAYDGYFYSEEKTKGIEKAFDYAWLHHIHNNPHHWQYWLLKEDDSVVSGNDMTVKCLDIPDNYIIEMVADWWSFSWKNYFASSNKDNLYSIFAWYEGHTDCILMHENAKQKVEDLLDVIHDILDQEA